MASGLRTREKERRTRNSQQVNGMKEVPVTPLQDALPNDRIDWKSRYKLKDLELKTTLGWLIKR